MASYLVTGGCGFIGSHVADALAARGDRVRILDDLSTGRRENAPADAEVMVGDVACAETVARAMDGMDGCVHLAAVASVVRSNEDWLGTHRVNQGGTLNVLEAARVGAGGPRPVVYASSAAVYGDGARRKLTEARRPRPLTAYGADKLGSEMHARVGALVHAIPTVGLRFFNVYGPRQDPTSPYSGVISIFCRRLREERPLIVFGDGRQTRDFVFVGDVVRFVLAALDRPPPSGDVFNVCTGRATSILRLARTLGKICGRAVAIEHRPPRPGDIRASVGDPGRAAAQLGLVAATALEDGLRRTVAAEGGGGD